MHPMRARDLTTEPYGSGKAPGQSKAATKGIAKSSLVASDSGHPLFQPAHFPEGLVVCAVPADVNPK